MKMIDISMRILLCTLTQKSGGQPVSPDVADINNIISLKLLLLHDEEVE